MVKVTELKHEKGLLLCISDIPGNTMGSELDKFLCIAHLLLMGDGAQKHFYLEKLGPSSAPTGYSMLLSNDLLNGQVKFIDSDQAKDLVIKRFGSEYVDVGIKFADLFREWLANSSWRRGPFAQGTGIRFLDLFIGQIAKLNINTIWKQAEHPQNFSLGNLEVKTVLDALKSFGASCTL